MQQHKPQFNNLHNLLPTPESRVQLSATTGIYINQINDWLNPDKRAIPKADSLIKMADYFDCSVDYLLDLASIKDRV